MNVSQLRSEYESKYKLFRQLIDTVKFSINKEIKRKKIKIHSFPHRIKKIDSFIDKIQKKQVKDPFNEIHDLVGLRIVCLFFSDLQLIRDILINNFSIIKEENKIDDTDVDIFGYMSLHYKAKLKDIESDSDYKNIKNIPFEIQVRTIAQDAWASISHYLDYKQGSNIPNNLRRDFHALSGLFYIADTHFAILRQEQSKYIINKEFNK